MRKKWAQSKVALPGSNAFLGLVLFGFGSMAGGLLHGCGGASGSGTSAIAADVAGPVGPAGPIGPAGPTGPAGPAGLNGSAGASWRPLGVTATVLTASSGNALTVNGTAAASAQTEAFFVRYTSAATTNSIAGVTQAFTQTQGRYRPRLNAQVRTDATIDARRIWIALTSASLAATDGTGVLATRYVGLRYSTQVSDVNWQCASGDGSTGSVVDTGVPVAANTVYSVQVDWSVNGALVCTVNGVSTVKVSNLDSLQTAALGVQNTLTTLSNAARAHFIAFIRLKYAGNDF